MQRNMNTSALGDEPVDATLEAQMDDAVNQVGTILAQLDDKQKHNFILALNREIRGVRSAEARQAVAGWNVGDRVVFKARGLNWVGTITKVNQKTVTVAARHVGDSSMGNIQWKVSASLVQSGIGVV